MIGVLFGFKFMIWILLILAAIAWIVLNSNKGHYRGKHRGRRLSNSGNWWDGGSHHHHHNHHHHNHHHGGHGGGHGGHH